MQNQSDIRNRIRAAISDTLVERNYLINTKDVLSDFLASISKISLIGFGTATGRDHLLKSILESSNTTYVSGRQEMVLDFLIAIYTNIKMQSLTAEDLQDIYTNSILELLDSKTIPQEYKDILGNIEIDTLMLVTFIIRMNLQYINNLLNKGEI